MDMRSTTSGVSSQESDEQQRNWTKQHWEKKAKAMQEQEGGAQ